MLNLTNNKKSKVKLHLHTNSSDGMQKLCKLNTFCEQDYGEVFSYSTGGNTKIITPRKEMWQHLL